MNLRIALLGAGILCFTGAAQAACRDDLVATAQDLSRTRTAVETAAQVGDSITTFTRQMRASCKGA